MPSVEDILHAARELARMVKTSTVKGRRFLISYRRLSQEQLYELNGLIGAASFPRYSDHPN